MITPYSPNAPSFPKKNQAYHKPGPSRVAKQKEKEGEGDVEEGSPPADFGGTLHKPHWYRTVRRENAERLGGIRFFLWV